MNNERNKKVEEILDSLDGSQRASLPVYFYTRLQARMLARQTGGQKGLTSAPQRSWVLRPAYALTALVVVLLINTAVILKGDGSNDNYTATDTETLQSFAAEYSLNDNNAILLDINQDK